MAIAMVAMFPVFGALAGAGKAPTGVEARGQRRVGAAVSAAYAVSASGRLTPAAYAAITMPRVYLGTGDGHRWRGTELGVSSTGANLSTFAFRVYVVKSGYTTGPTPTDWEAQLWGTATCTVGSSTGAVSGGVVDSTERNVVTITWVGATSATSPPGVSVYLQSAYASPAVTTYSPGTATPAKIMFPDCGSGEYLLIDVGDTGGATVAFYADSFT